MHTVGLVFLLIACSAWPQLWTRSMRLCHTVSFSNSTKSPGLAPLVHCPLSLATTLGAFTASWQDTLLSALRQLLIGFHKLERKGCKGGHLAMHSIQPLLANTCTDKNTFNAGVGPQIMRDHR
jgi:hypothetical protein